MDFLQLIPSWLVSVVAFIIMLGLLVFVHELGHFATAVRMGIKVEEFGFGYPPRMLTLLERNGVKYTLNWLPLGGFVRFAGEDDAIHGVGGLATAAPWRRILVLAAGPLMNLLLAMVIFAGLFMANGVPATTPEGELIVTKARVTGVYPGTPAASAGIQVNDELISLDGQPVNGQAVVAEVAKAKVGQPIDVVVVRDGQELDLSVTPGPWTTEDGREIVGLGIGYAPIPENRPAGFFEALGRGVTHTIMLTGALVDGLVQLIVGLFDPNTDVPAGGVAGPIGIARGTGEVIEQQGAQGFWVWTAILSINLFLFNLLPIPALDGSRILFALLEMLRRGKRVPAEKEALVHAVGFAMLMGLMVLISFSDIVNALSGRSVLSGG
jgi:regulator of sigma E protease